MMGLTSKVATVLLGIFLVFGANATKPDPGKTPGVICQSTDSDFTEYRYPEKIPYCARNISQQEKQQVAQEYGNIPQSEWPNYEFDHLIPLAIGGSNNIGNLWPEPITEAHEKDVLENELFHQMSAGTITQAQAVQKIRDWVNAH